MLRCWTAAALVCALWPAAHDNKSKMGAATFAMNFFLAACSWAVPVANVLPQLLQPLGACRRMCGPADVCDTHKVRLFSLEPTLPARPAHDTHVVGRLHVRHSPTRLAHVDRADRVYEAASGSSRCSLDIYHGSQPRAERRHGFLMCHLRYAHIVVHAFARSVCHARG